jgi:hypothetical protein
MDYCNQMNYYIIEAKIDIFGSNIKKRDFIYFFVLRIIDNVFADKTTSIFLLEIPVNTVYKMGKDNKKPHHWRIKCALSAKKGKKESYQEEYAIYIIFFKIDTIVFYSPVKQKQV